MALVWRDIAAMVYMEKKLGETGTEANEKQGYDFLAYHEVSQS
jgi:hypothetical protein